MIRLTAREIAGLLGGTLFGDPEAVVIGDAQTDSRLVGPGDVFFAMPGATTDGARFAPSAVEAGAVLVVAERRVDVDAPIVVVPSALDALSALAREVVARVRALGRLRVVAVTGSNGKTTTKNMLRAILSSAGETVAPEGSFNNEVGAPITMLRVTEDTAFLVIEMGADAVGDVAKLVALAVPDVGIVLKVGTAHIGKFGSQEAIAVAKGEMVRDLPASAVAVLNADDPNVAAMPTAAQVRPFGLVDRAAAAAPDPAAWLAADVRISLGGTAFTLLHGGERQEVRLRILGEHHVMNALAALAAADAVGVAPAEAVPALEGMVRAERWRMELLGGGPELPGDVTVINDAYNASPESTAAALRTLAELTRGRARAIAVIGEMAELGEFATEAHDRIGRLAVRLNVDHLVVVGERARAMHLGAQHEGSWGSEVEFVETADAAYDAVRALLRAGDVVLVKSSKSAGLRHLGDRLAGIELPESEANA
ncbi:MAG: UDP-N-acetylmuramoyl-tripeptide--D-alanyl-D-alanine ligase [Microbacteriaceae bacterium]|nr:UDP-N-acetylmuramoyl-tripeptide--D-alanyl-D-alanine ligase [Microbacteriaceae bacterium]